jgi:hypothetical protein
MLAHGTLVLVHQIPRDFGDSIANGFAQGRTQGPEETRARHEHQSIESLLSLRLRELARNAAGEAPRLLDARAALAAGRVMRDCAAAPRARGAIEDAPWPV